MVVVDSGLILLLFPTSTFAAGIITLMFFKCSTMLVKFRGIPEDGSSGFFNEVWTWTGYRPDCKLVRVPVHVLWT